MAVIIISEAIKGSSEILKAANVEMPLLEARAILCSLLNCETAYLYAHGSEKLDDGLSALFNEKVCERAEGVPLQHLTGMQEFMSLDFRVDRNVLIPRQDTEILVETVINQFSSSTDSVRILDMCTGSGCIAVSLAYYLKNCRVTAVDISGEAIEVAKTNAGRYGLGGRMEFILSDLFSKVEGKFHAIVSNPPYIRSDVIEQLSAEVRDFEPRLALDGGADGLDFYKRIVAEAPVYLVKDGVLAVETGFDQGKQVAGLMLPSFTEVKIIKDFSGNDRVVTGRMPFL